MIDQEDSMVDSKWPERSISNSWPMNSSVQHHCSGNCHDRADVSFRNSIVVVCSYAGEIHDLSEDGKILTEFR